MSTITDALTFQTGDAQLLKDLLSYGSRKTAGQEDYAPLAPFAPETIEFLTVWSDTIRALPREEKDSAAAAFGFWCRRASVLKMKEDYPDLESGYLGKGICLQFVPSNIPALFAYSLAAGLLAGNAVVMRLPSQTGRQSEILLGTLKKALEAQPFFKKRIIIIKYAHDRKVTDWLSLRCDVRIIWGGDQTVQEIQQSPLKSTAVDIPFPDRKSLAVADAEYVLGTSDLSGIVRDFYNDTYLHDQNACSSPRLICWIGSRQAAKDAADRFWSAVSDHLGGVYVVEAETAVRKLENAMLLAGCGMADKILFRDNNLMRVQVDTLQPELWDHTVPGGFFLETFADGADILAPMLTEKCQTISCIGDVDFQAMINECMGRYGSFQVTACGHTLDFSLNWDRQDLIRSSCRKQPEECCVEHEGCRFHVLRQGRGPVLILVHGVGCDCSFYHDAAMLLENDYTVITYDRRGYSESINSVPSDAQSESRSEDQISRQSADLIAILDALEGPDAKAYVVGSSAGGLISLDAARRYPDRVRKLMIYESPYTTDLDDLALIEDWRLKLIEAAERKRIASAMLLFIQAIGRPDPAAKEKNPEEFRQNMINLERFLYTEMDSLLDYSKNYPDFRLQLPCICGIGTLDTDNLFGRMMEHTAKSWNVPCDRLEGCHNIAEDRPGTFAKWVRAGLNI